MNHIFQIKQQRTFCLADHQGCNKNSSVRTIGLGHSKDTQGNHMQLVSSQKRNIQMFTIQKFLLQKKNWANHKNQCKFYKQMVNNKKLSVHNQIASEFVLNLRIAVLIRKDPAISKAYFSHINLEEYQPPQKMQYFQEMVVVLLENMQEQRNEANLSQMMRQLNIVSVNAFTIQDFLCETDGVAIGFFSPASYFNHNCQPNCTQYFDGRYLTVMANREILPKEQLTISYTNPLALIEQRRAFLTQKLSFLMLLLNLSGRTAY